MNNSLYLLVNLLALSVPLFFSFHPKLAFHKQWKYFFPACFFSMLVFIPWDIFFTGIGIWGFNSNYILRYKFLNLPLEEILFFICIPYASIFTHHSLFVLGKSDYLKKHTGKITPALILLLLLLIVRYHDRLYTIVTFSFCIILLLVFFILKLNWLHRFYFTYLIILIPFFMVNGILTGSFIADEVVWYNNNENMAFRLGTIPFEDVFYGMALLLLNTAIYEHLAQRNSTGSLS